MAIKITAGQPSPILSLRWKTLITLSLILAVVNGSLAYYAYQQLFRQFDVQQAQVRERQEIQFNALFADRFRQMSRIGNLVPLLAPLEPHDDLRGPSYPVPCRHTGLPSILSGISAPYTG